MGWKDLMKNVTDKATSIAETAQEKLEEQKQLSAIKKEEQNKKMEEMNERVTEYEQELLQNILSGFSGAPCIEVEDNILDFTKDYFEKLLLPANSVSASKITMYPYSDKIQKKAQKALREYDDTETPVFQFEGNKGEFILMTPTKLYIAVAFPENQTFVANVAVDLQQVSQFGFVSTEEGYQVVCNGVELFSADNVSEFDRITIEEYVRRLEEKDFEITETQIDEVIKKKIGDNILRIIRQYVFDDELLIYFAWGMDNITARTIYMRNRMKYGEKFCNSNHVICKENGEPYRPKSFTSKWSKTLKKYGLRHIKLHGTRHSAISLLLSEGVPIQIAQQRAGHQDPKITLGVYSHVSKDKESLVADTLEDVLFSAVGE